MMTPIAQQSTGRPYRCRPTTSGAAGHRRVAGGQVLSQGAQQLHTPGGEPPAPGTHLSPCAQRPGAGSAPLAACGAPGAVGGCCWGHPGWVLGVMGSRRDPPEAPGMGPQGDGEQEGHTGGTQDGSLGRWAAGITHQEHPGQLGVAGSHGEHPSAAGGTCREHPGWVSRAMGTHQVPPGWSRRTHREGRDLWGHPRIPLRPHPGTRGCRRAP